MKIANILIVFGVTFACLCGTCSANAGVRGDALAKEEKEIEPYEEEGEIEAYEEGEIEDSMERLLAKKKLKRRCAFPGEEADCDKDETSRFKPDKWCKKYCFVCPCSDDDQEIYYDWKGSLIEDVCSNAVCGKKDRKRPCKKYPEDANCCECTQCKSCEILPAGHDLCTPLVAEETSNGCGTTKGGSACRGAGLKGLMQTGGFCGVYTGDCYGRCSAMRPPTLEEAGLGDCDPWPRGVGSPIIVTDWLDIAGEIIDVGTVEENGQN